MTRQADATDDRTYAVLIDTGYYDGDCQHPSGWSLRIAERDVAGHGQRIEHVIGSLADCQAWIAEEEEGPTYLAHGEVSQTLRIAEIVDRDADYQGWIDTIANWDGCPSPDGSDYSANCAWAEDQAYQADGVLPVVANDGRELYLIDLSPIV